MFNKIQDNEKGVHYLHNLDACAPTTSLLVGTMETDEGNAFEM